MSALGSRTSRPRGGHLARRFRCPTRWQPVRTKPTPGRMPGARARCPRTQCGRDVRAPEGRPLAPTRPAFALVHVALRAHKKALRPKLTRVGESDKRAVNPYTHPKSAGADTGHRLPFISQLHKPLTAIAHLLPPSGPRFAYIVLRKRLSDELSAAAGPAPAGPPDNREENTC